MLNSPTSYENGFIVRFFSKKKVFRYCWTIKSTFCTSALFDGYSEMAGVKLLKRTKSQAHTGQRKKSQSLCMKTNKAKSAFLHDKSSVQSRVRWMKWQVLKCFNSSLHHISHLLVSPFEKQILKRAALEFQHENMGPFSQDKPYIW